MAWLMKSVNWDWNKSHKKRCYNLFDTSFRSDFVLILGQGQERTSVGVHKIFLQSASRILDEEIENNVVGFLVIEEVEARIFKFLLQFIYTGECNYTPDFPEHALEVMGIAMDYEIWELMDQCASVLSGTLSNENALSLFQEAMRFEHKGLIKSTLDYICENAYYILKDKEFRNLRLECLIEIIQQDKLVVFTEMDVLNAVFQWGEAECIRKELDPSDNTLMRTILKKALKHIRFPLMDPTEFASDLVANKNLLVIKESLDLLLWFFLVAPHERSTIDNYSGFSSSPRLYICSDETFTFSRSLVDEPRESLSLVAGLKRLTFWSETLLVMANWPCHIKKILFPAQILPFYDSSKLEHLRCVRDLVVRLRHGDDNTCDFHTSDYPLQINTKDLDELILDLQADTIKLPKSGWIRIEVQFGFNNCVRDPNRPGGFSLSFVKSGITEAIPYEKTSSPFELQLKFKRPEESPLPIASGLMNKFIVGFDSSLPR